MNRDQTGTGVIADALGVKEISLRYEDGGRTQLITTPDGTEYRFPGSYHNWDIVAAIKKDNS